MLLLLYRRNFPQLRSYITRNSGDISDAEDMMQESLVIFWQKAQQESFTLTAKLDTFLFAVAKNLWLKQLRKNGREIVQDMTSDHSLDLAEEDEADSDLADQHAALAKYLDKIGDTCKDLLSLFYFEGWDMERIAVKLRFANAQTAKAKKYQCKKKLEELIKQHYTAEDLL